MPLIGSNACHAWGQCNAAGSLYDDYNISSVTDQGTGDMQFNFSTNFDSQYDYAAICTGRSETSVLLLNKLNLVLHLKLIIAE